jgi:hypothetical protein
VSALARQQRCACGGFPGAEGECAACREARLQRSGRSLRAGLAPPAVHEVLRSPGRPLTRSARDDLGTRLGHDFSRVRVHDDPRAARSARAVDANAYTVGNHVVFDSGRYAPATVDGRRLLTHELAHVVQQRDAGEAGGRELLIDDRQSAAERNAERSAADGERPAPGGGLRVSRQGTTATPPAPTKTAPPVPATGGLTEEMLQQIVRGLRVAMAGLGTDETAIYAALGGRTQEQVDAISLAYAERYHRPLMDDLRDELSESELHRLEALAPIAKPGSAEATSAAEATRLADMVAAQLDDAMRGLGTDETAIYGSLTGRTTAELQPIKDAYRRRTGRELEADLRDELSGSDLTRALRLLNQGMLAPEDELYLAMEGLGTDEDTIFRVLDAMAGSSTAITAMETAYRTKYGDLIADLRGDLSGEDYAHAMRVLQPVLADVAFEDCGQTIIPEIRALVPVGIAKVDRAIQVLSQRWSGMSPTEQAVFNQYFDPHGDGIDQSFVSDVLHNFRLIRRVFDNDLTIECEQAGGLCTGTRLYYTYWSNIHVCPYFTSETDATRKAQDLVHELTHNALMAVDRPYYDSQHTAYVQMTPRGPLLGRIPVLGPLFTFISRSDTLNSPDAYAFFAFNV